MAMIQRWEPLRELTAIREAMDRLLEESFIPMRRWMRTVEGRVPIDMFERDNQVVVQAVVPGLKPENLKVRVEQNTLIIEGETKAAQEVREEQYLAREWRYGRVYRAITLPPGLDTEKAEAQLANGILTITFPKLAQVAGKTIPVKEAH